MGLKGCGGFMKYSMFLFNSLILVAGCGLVGFGIYTRTNQTGVTAKFSSILGSSILPSVALTLIITGSVVIFISFLGCCGAIKEVRCMLVTFFTLLLLILIGLITGIILIFVYKSKLESLAVEQLREQLTSSYGQPGEGKLTEAWDSMQKLFKCCGVQGGVNSTESWAIYKLNTDWHRDLRDEFTFVPESCCKDPLNTPNLEQCQGMFLVTAPKVGPPVSPAQENDQLYTTGCFTAFKNIISNNIDIFIGVVCGLAAVMVLGMTFALCLCRRIRDDYYECDDDE